MARPNAHHGEKTVPASPPGVPRWVLLAGGVLLTAGVMAAIAGDQAPAVFQTLIFGIFVVPVVLAAGMLGLLFTEPFEKRGCFADSPWPRGYRALVAIALGLGAFALAVLAMGSVHLIEPGGNPWAPVAIPVIGVAAGYASTRRFLSRKVGPSFLKDKARRGDWLFLLAAVPTAMLLIAATFPPGSLWMRTESNGYDALEYHLELPREYADANSTAPVHHNMYSFFPSNVEMLYLLLMQLAKGVMQGDRATGYVWGAFPAQLFHALLILLTAAALALMPAGPRDKPWLFTTGRAIAVLVFLGIPWTIITGSLAYNEAGMLFFGTLALGQAVSGTYSRAAGILIGLLLGLAVGCKMTAGVFFALPVSGILLARAWRERAQLRSLITAALVAAAVYVPWAIRAAIYSGGNPVFPVGTSVLPRDGWSAEQVERFDRGHAAPVALRPLLVRLRTLADNSILDAQWSTQPYALITMFADPPELLDTPWKRLGLLWPAVPLALACAFVSRPGRRETGMLVLSLVIAVAAWLFATHLQARFLLPAAIPLSLLVGRGVQGTHNSVEGTVIAGLRIIAGAIVGLHVLSIVFVLLPGAHILGGVVKARPALSPKADWAPLDEPPIGRPFSMVFNLAGEVEHPDEPGTTAPFAKVLLVGESRTWRYGGEVDYATVFDRQPFLEALRRGSADALAWLRQRGIRYVFINGAEVERLRRTYGFDPEPSVMTAANIAALQEAGITETHLLDPPLMVLRVPQSPQ